GPRRTGDVPSGRWLGIAVQLRHRQRALANRRAVAVGPRVTAPDDHDVLALGTHGGGTVALALAVGGHEVFHRQVDALQLPPRRGGVVTPPQRSHREYHGVEALPQLLHGDIDTDLAARDEANPLLPQLREPAV